MKRIDESKVVPVVVLKALEDTIPTLSALLEGNLAIAEITYRTECAPQAMKLAIETFPDMLIGAGTIINENQAKEAIDIGAKFIVGPGFDKGVSDVCKQKNIPYYPGCVTPTEIIQALQEGWKVIKFFPASVYGGLKTMQALAGPFPQITFIPTGGIDASNLHEYLAWDKIKAVGGSWMMKGDIVAQCNQIHDIVKESKV